MLLSFPVGFTITLISEEIVYIVLRRTLVEDVGYKSLGPDDSYLVKATIEEDTGLAYEGTALYIFFSSWGFTNEADLSVQWTFRWDDSSFESFIHLQSSPFSH
jgi:hypothetical protein